MVLSLAAETICLLSAEKATESTSLVWSSNLQVVCVKANVSLRKVKMVLEPAGGLASGEVPQPQGLVPGARQGKVSVRGKNLDHQLNISSSHQSNSCNEGTKYI